MRHLSTLALLLAAGAVGATAIAGPAEEAPAEDLARMEMQLGHRGGALGELSPCSLQLYGTGVGIWQGEKQFSLKPEEMHQILSTFREARFSALPATLGQPEGDPRSARPGGASSRISVTVGTAPRTVTQLSGGEQSPEFLRLAKALRQACEAAVKKNGKGCKDLDQGLKQVAEAKLSPEVFSGQLLTYRMGEGNAGSSGWQLVWSGGELVASRVVKGATTDEHRRRATPEEIKALAEAFREAGFERLPPHVYHTATVLLNAAVLNHSNGLQAHPLDAYKQKATPQEEKRLSNLVERVQAVHAGVMKAEKKAPASPDRGGGEEREKKILARGVWLHLPVFAAAPAPRGKHHWVIRSEKDLARAAGAHALPAVLRSLKVKAIDFERQMLVAVGDGDQPMVGVSGGAAPSAPCRVDIPHVQVESGGKVLTVHWRRVPRDPAAGVITYPLAAVLVERFEGEVKFDQLPTKGSGGAGSEPREAETGTGRAVKIEAQASWPDGWKEESPAQQWVVRGEDDLVDPRIEAPSDVIERLRREKVERYARALGVPAIDFQKQMIVGVSAGVQPTGGYRVEVTRVEEDRDGKGATIVLWRLRTPPPDQLAAQELTHPAEVVLIERREGLVQFRRVADAPR
jgi:hypothetical protein